MSKVDPIRDEYYKPLDRAEAALSVLFYVSAVLSLVAPFVERAAHPKIYDDVQLAFLVSVIGFFAVGLAIRLYFSPRAQEKRYQDFLSHAFGIRLGHLRTEGYYNTEAKEIPKRIAAQVLENTFHSKDIALGMARFERVRIAVYAVLWIVVISVRSTDLATISIVAQIIFSEQLLSRWLRIEWLRCRCESAFENLFRLIQSDANLEVVSLEWLGRYEIAKANAAITLSQKIFERRRQQLGEAWDSVREQLGL